MHKEIMTGAHDIQWDDLIVRRDFGLTYLIFTISKSVATHEPHGYEVIPANLRLVIEISYLFWIENFNLKV